MKTIRKYIITPINRVITAFKAFKETYKTEPWDGWDTLVLICSVICIILISWAIIIIISML